MGSAIRRFLASPSCPISRADIFYCSKLQSNHGYRAAKQSIADSLQKCGLGYIDLYLIHSPYGGKQKRLESWRAIQEAKDQGLVKSIGVSNYGQRHIQELLESQPKYKPTVNQCDLHPFMARLALVEYCRSKAIQLECWGPLVRAQRFDHPVIVKLASKHSVTPAQVLIRFSLQQGYITVSLHPAQDSVVQDISANRCHRIYTGTDPQISLQAAHHRECRRFQIPTRQARHATAARLGRVSSYRVGIKDKRRSEGG